MSASSTDFPDDLPPDPFDDSDEFAEPATATPELTRGGAGAGAGTRGVRRARAKPSLKMQAIGYLSRREYSRLELRKKLLAWLRQCARDEAALAAAAEAATRAQAEALRDWPSNGIDDAFAPPAAPQPAAARRPAKRRSGAARPTRAGAHEPSSPADSALAGLRLASGAPIPVVLREALSALQPETPVPPTRPSAAALDSAQPEDPETVVDQLLDWLAAQRYLSETRFVESRVNARSRKHGTAMIKHELARHGLALEPEQAAVLRQTEFARAQALWQRKFGTVATDRGLRAKQARFLAARGFASDVVRRIVGGEDED